MKSRIYLNQSQGFSIASFQLTSCICWPRPWSNYNFKGQDFPGDWTPEGWRTLERISAWKLAGRTQTGRAPQAELAKVKAELAKAKSELADSANSMSELTAELAKAKSELADSANSTSELTAELAKAKSELAEAKSELVIQIELSEIEFSI